MTKKMLWYVALGLLCCGLGAWAVNTTVSQRQSRNGLTDVRGASVTNEADIIALKAAHTSPVTGTSNVSAASAAAAAKAAAYGVPATAAVGLNASQEITVQYSENPEAAAAFQRWLATGTKTEADIPLIESMLPPQGNPDRNPLDLTGGPDLAGYRFVDNTGADTATFAWVELCGDGSAFDGPAGDDVVSNATLGWSFPYYGSNYTIVTMHTNGYITFTDPGFSDFSNSCVDVEDLLRVASYWDDHYAGNGAGGCNNDGVGPWVRYRDFGTHFVVEWSQVQHYSTSTDRYSHQIILYPDGKIKFQYNTNWNDAATPNSASIHIDGIGAGNGLEYRCDAVGPGTQITGGRAIWFYIQPIAGVDLRTSLLAPCGTIPPNPTQGVSVRVTNHGTVASAATTARFDFDGGATLGSFAVPPLAPSSFFDVFFTVTVNVTLGAHTLVGHVDADAGEAPADTSNNTSNCNVNGNNCFDDCAFVTPVPLPATFDCDNTGATHDCGLLTVGEGETWHAFTIPNTCNVTITECGQAGNWQDFYIVLTTGCPCAATVFSTNYIFPDPNCPNGGIELHYIGLPAGTYYIPVLAEAAFGAVGAYHIEVTCVIPPPCVPDFTVTAPGSASGNTAGAGDDCIVGGSGFAEDQMVEVTIPTTGEWTFSLCGGLTTYDSRIILSTECCAGTVLFNNDDFCGLVSQVSCFTLTAGTYYLLIDGFVSGSVGAWGLDITECAPCILTPVGIAEAVEVQDSTNETGDPNGGCNNDDCGGTNSWSIASCGGDYTGTTFYYQSSIACGGGGIFRDTDWWELTIASAESIVVTITAENPTNDFVAFITDDNCATGPATIAVAQQINSCTAFTVATPECLNPGTYYIVVLPASSGAVGVSWDYNMSVACTPCTPCVPPANDDCANAVNVGVLGGTPITLTGNNLCATSDCPSLGTPEVWYQFTTVEQCTVKIDFCGTVGFGNFYIVLETGCPCTGTHTFYDVFNFTDCGDGMFTCYWYDLPAGTYWYPVLSEPGSEGPFTITFGNCGSICDSVRDVRIYPSGTGVPHDGVNLFWASPEDLQDTIYVYSTDSTDADTDPDFGGDADWDHIATIFRGDSVTNDGFGTTTRKYHDPRLYVRYRKYDLVRNYCFTPPPPPPPCLADSCELNEITAANGVPFMVDNTCATTNPAWPCGAGGKDVWISYTATATGTVSVSTCSGIGTLGDTVLEAWTDCPGNGGTSLVCLDDFCGVRTTITFAGSAGVTYKIRLGGFASGAGSAEVVITG